ncbi:hypothetical protein [Rhodoferax saidenbachensis]|uniref:Uncharacterized protein n=1 Tax=Rhodoferax saidenbachensis TaxID=1484693 RepID=A0A1P8KAI1_9BURK|nr:hypothetical protein [Rhodoferax saidenbachensis]APW43019.1 hypothetical protein RS694_11060 [Rhodoferax saidenbachensis]
MLQFFKRAVPAVPEADKPIPALRPSRAPDKSTEVQDSQPDSEVLEGNEDTDWRRWDDAVAMQSGRGRAWPTDDTT